MTRLVLFSLEVLVNVPRLFVQGLITATNASEQEICDALMSTGCDPLRAIGALVPKEKVGETYAKFLPLVSRGAHRLVKDHAHSIINECHAQDIPTGIFYPLPQRAVEEIVRSSKLRPRVQFGYAGLDELRQKVDERGAEDITYVLGRIVHLPEEFTETAEPPRVYRESRDSFPAFFNQE